MYTQINKKHAKNLFNIGERIYLLPSKAVIGSAWIQPMSVCRDKDFPDYTFEKACNAFAYYNCSKETGKGIKFFIWD